MLAAAPLALSSTPESFEAVDRIVALGDVHGDYDNFVSLVRGAKLINSGTSWTGGAAHLALPGDFMDRGNATRKVLDLLMDLEPQAEKAGGKVHALLGNHETMNLFGDLRYAVPADFEAFRTSKSADVRQEALQSAMLDEREKLGRAFDTAAFRQKFEADHPLGWVERGEAFSANGKYGKWLRQKNAVVKINDLIFVHGGISPKYASSSLKSINSRVHEELDDFSRLKSGMVTDDEGPLWYRGLAEAPESDRSVSTALDEFLRNQKARHIVIGHTVQLAILPRFEGKVIAIDVGLSHFYNGPPAYLLVETGKLYAMHRGTRLELPMDEKNRNNYLRSAAQLEPRDSPLRRKYSK
jgi:hypothetical protein